MCVRNTESCGTMCGVRSFVTTPEGPALLAVTDESEEDAAARLGGACVSCRNPVGAARQDAPGSVLLDEDLWCWNCFFEVQHAELEPRSYGIDSDGVASARLTGRKARHGSSVTT
jgi:hypothetical protein